MRCTFASDGYCARAVPTATSRIANPTAAIFFIIPVLRSCPLQLGELLHQFLGSEALEFYRNLGVLTFSFTLVDDSHAVLGMANLHARTETALAAGLGNLDFRTSKLLP